MLISKETECKWNAKNKNHYVELGYNFTRMNETFISKIKDLTKGSSSIIEVRCDYCNEIYNTTWCTYRTLKEKDNKNDIRTDCCGKPDCTTYKSKEVILKKYGVSNIRKIDGIEEKIERTNMERYGCKNPFGNKLIQEKLKNTNIEKYGFKIPSKNKKVAIKIKKGCNEFYKNNPEKKMIGSKSPNWIGDQDYKRSQRSTFVYNEWRKQVYNRDNYTCQCCKMKRTNSKQPSLNAHHIFNFSKYEKLRTDIENGITLCKICHTKFHSIYGKKYNTREQLEEFLKLDEKIC